MSATDKDRTGLGPLFTFDAPREDQSRLGRQYAAVFSLMRDGAWRTLAEIREAVGAVSEAGVSARLRDARKARFGSHIVDRRRVSGGLYQYRLIERGIA